MRLSSNEVESRNHYTQLTVKSPPLTLNSGSVPDTDPPSNYTIYIRALKEISNILEEALLQESEFEQDSTQDQQ